MDRELYGKERLVQSLSVFASSRCDLSTTGLITLDTRQGGVLQYGHTCSNLRFQHETEYFSFMQYFDWILLKLITCLLYS